MMNAIEVNKKKHNIPRHGLLLCFFFAIIFTKNRLTFYLCLFLVRFAIFDFSDTP